MKEKTLIILNKTFQYGFGVTPFIISRNPLIPHYLKALYNNLLSYAWYNAECFPGQDKLAKEIGVSIQTISNQLKELKELGLLDWKRRGLNKTNIYYILDIPKELIPQKSEADLNSTLNQDLNSTLTPTIEVDEELNNEDPLEAKLRIREEKRSHKRNPFGNYSAKPYQYPERKKIKYIKVGDVR